MGVTTAISEARQRGLLLDQPEARRSYKDRIFRMIFKEKEALLALYNAMNDTEYTNTDDLIITTLENAIYLGMKNDISFVIFDWLFLYEHQSTQNPNMPLRNLFYVADLYSALTRDEFLYGEIAVSIPAPQFVVFYNGEKEMEERVVLKLSDLYKPTVEHPSLELETIVLNINKGYNVALMEKCRELHDYSTFVALVREKQRSGLPLILAVNDAVEECIRNNVMADFLRKNRAEVLKVSIYEYDEEETYKLLKRQYENAGLARGMEKGIAEGMEKGMAEGMEKGIAEGMERGKLTEQIRGIIKKIQKNCSPSQAAEYLDMDEAFVRIIYQIAEQMAPDYDIEKIFEIYQKQDKTCN